MSDERTEEQHMADVANTTLGRLAKIRSELHSVSHQLNMLSYWAGRMDDDDELLASDRAELLALAAENAMDLATIIPGMVRDIASTLPMRGVEYGNQ